MITVTLSYFGWWLIIVPTQTAWYRYIFIGYILLEICLVMIVSLLVKYSLTLAPKTRKIPYILCRVFMVGYIILLVVGAGYNFIHSKNYLISFKDSPDKTAVEEAGQYIRTLPKNAKIYGYAYFQAPVVSFASGRTFDNLLNNSETWNAGPLNEKYFVVDFYAYYLDPGGYQNILGQFDNRLVFSQGKNSIYQLNSRPLFAYEDFSDAEKRQVSYSKIDFTRDDLDAFVRNVYVDEKNNYGKWAQEVSGYLFKYNGESTLKIDLWFQNLEKYDQNPIELRIYANRVLVYYYPVDHDGLHEILVPLKNIGGDTLEITIACNSRVMLEGDDRQLAFFLNELEIVK
jgi:hypothetical protein